MISVLYSKWKQRERNYFDFFALDHAFTYINLPVRVLAIIVGTLALFLTSHSRKIPRKTHKKKNLKWFSGNIISQQILTWEIWPILSMKACLIFDRLMMLGLRFDWKKLKKLGFQKQFRKLFLHHCRIFFWNVMIGIGR